MPCHQSRKLIIAIIDLGGKTAALMGTPFSHHLVSHENLAPYSIQDSLGAERAEIQLEVA
jgi:hypothetical protein